MLPIGISVDQPDKADQTRDVYEIPFPIFADPDLVVHEAFQVVHQADEEEVERLKGFGINFESASGRDHHRFAVPSIFLIEDNKVIWSHAEIDYRIRPSLDQILAAIDAL